MSLPLPLELTQPVLLAGDLNSEIRAQMCSRTHSYAKCKSLGVGGILQVDGTDVVVDDVVA
jgi:hypothetical protein